MLRPFGAAYRAISDALAAPRARLWGFADRPSNRHQWEKLEAGDVGLGYADGAFLAVVELAATLRSPELGVQLFGFGESDDVALITVFREASHIDIKRETFNDALGYSPTFVPRALFVPGPARQDFIAERFTSRRAFVRALDKAEATSAIARFPQRFVQQSRDDEVLRSPGPRVVKPAREPEATSPRRGPHALLGAPNWVSEEDAFPVTVGLSSEPTSALGGLFESPLGAEYDLDVLIVADGFTLEAGTWRNTLRVSPDQPYPSTRISLRRRPNAPRSLHLIQALYAIGGRTLGLAARFVDVVRPDEQPTAEPPQFPGTILPVSDEYPAPDLTIRIIRSDESDTRLLWSFSTSHPEVSTPDEAIATTIGARPDRFAEQVMRGVPAHEDEEDLYPFLVGVGSRIRDAMPRETWDIVRHVAALKPNNERPTVLLLSDEPYVPWELAVLEDPPLPKLPPFLNVQTAIGRWILLPHGRHFPPPVTAHREPFSVVAGQYAGDAALRSSTAEAEALENQFGAQRLHATLPALRKCLAGNPLARVLHFAVHGTHDPASRRDGLLLDDGKYLDPNVIRGHHLPAGPLVFLNACEVGAGDEALGAYAGTAEAFIYAGAAAVVAPLWAIRDAEAREVAVEFYGRTFAGGPAGEILADERARFTDRSRYATRLAYQLFAHPLVAFSDPLAASSPARGLP